MAGMRLKIEMIYGCKTRFENGNYFGWRSHKKKGKKTYQGTVKKSFVKSYFKSP
jgi:hypothetical protein